MESRATRGERGRPNRSVLVRPKMLLSRPGRAAIRTVIDSWARSYVPGPGASPHSLVSRKARWAGLFFCDGLFDGSCPLKPVDDLNAVYFCSLMFEKALGMRYAPGPASRDGAAPRPGAGRLRGSSSRCSVQHQGN